MDGYQLAGKISEGRFGTVFLACSIETGEKVAIKKIRARRPIPGLNVDPWSKSAEREIEVLSQVRHRHVVRLLDHLASPLMGSFVLVYELLSWDLEAMLLRRKALDESEVKIVMQMLLTGLAYLHSLEVMHRDIKPSNLLMEAVTGVLKIADFGSARFCPTAAGLPGLSGLDVSDCMEEDLRECEQPLTREVCSRWYKSPEMLFGSIDYDLAVDLWATGCVLGFLLSPTAQALFAGQSDIDQLCCIFRLRGTPLEKDWPEAWLLPDFAKIEFSVCEPQPFALSECSLETIELVERLLQLNPAKRVMAAEALVGSYFHASPAVAEPQSLVSSVGDLEPASVRPQDSEDFVSDGSDFGSPDWEFETIPIETTSCGLWDGAVAAGTLSEEQNSEGLASPVATVFAAEAAPSAATGRIRHPTPPPPKSGVHRFKPGVF